MSRDWTPAELYIADKAIENERGYSLRDAEITLVREGEADIPLTDKEVKAEYPELSFLFDGFARLYEKYKGDKEVKAIFDQFEQALLEVETSLEKERCEPLSLDFWKLDDEALCAQPVALVAQEWFYGRLDSSFYYNEYNNSVFYLVLRTKISETQGYKENAKSCECMKKKESYDDR